MIIMIWAAERCWFLVILSCVVGVCFRFVPLILRWLFLFPTNTLHSIRDRLRCLQCTNEWTSDKMIRRLHMHTATSSALMGTIFNRLYLNVSKWWWVTETVAFTHSLYLYLHFIRSNNQRLNINLPEDHKITIWRQFFVSLAIYRNMSSVFGFMWPQVRNTANQFVATVSYRFHILQMRI